MKTLLHVRNSLIVLFTLLLIVGFQNCSGPSATSKATAASVDPTQLSLSQIQQVCAAAIGKPSFSGASVSQLNITSALGFANSGDAASAAFNANSSFGILDSSVFGDGTYNCQTKVNLNLKCSLVTGDASKPVSIISAIDPMGNNALAAQNADQNAIAAKTINMNDCMKGFQYPSSTLNLAKGVNPNSNDMTAGYRCVAGSFWLKLTTQNSVTGVANSGQSSDPQYVKVVLSNGCWNQTNLSRGTTLPANQSYGLRVAVDGNWAAVLSPSEANGATAQVGSVDMYFFDGSKWNFTQTLFPNGAAANDMLASVAIQGSNLVLGSAFRSGGGAVYLFANSGNTWSQVGGAVASPDAQAGQNFGYSVAINNSTLFVGSPNYALSADSNAGAVYIFSIGASGLTYKQTLTLGAGSANKGFGTSIAASGNNLAVGAPQALTKEYLGSGEVDIYQSNGTSYVFTKKVTTSSALAAGSKFGASVAINGPKLIVGAPLTQVGNNLSQGTVYYFADWTANETKTFNGSAANDNYGYSVAFGNNLILISAPYSTSSTGLVDAFDLTSFNKKSVRATNSTPNNFLGSAIAASGNNVIVGASKKDNPNYSAGAAYLFSY